MMNGVLSPFFDETKTCPPKSAIAPPRHKTRTLSRYASKEIIKPFPSARKLYQMIQLTLSSATPSLPRQGGTDIVFYTTYPFPSALARQTYAKPFTQHNKQKVAPFDRR